MGELANKAVPVLEELRREKQGSNRIVAARALCKIDTHSKQKYVRTITSGLSDKDATVRYRAADYLQEFPDDSADAITALGVTLKDKDDNVRFKTCQALEVLGRKAAKLTPALKEVSKNDRSEGVRRAAARTLKAIEK